MKGIAGTLLMTVLGWTALGFAADSAAPVTGDRVTREAKEAAKAAKDYTFQQKDAFQKKIQAELDDMQAEIVRLRQRTGRASASVRTDLQQAIADLEKKREAARRKLDEVGAAGSASWEQLKGKMHEAMDDLSAAYRKTVSKLP